MADMATITVTADKPGRVVTVCAGAEALSYLGNLAEGLSMTGNVTLEVGPGEWTWLTPAEAREVAAALVRAAAIASKEMEL